MDMRITKCACKTGNLRVFKKQTNTSMALYFPALFDYFEFHLSLFVFSPMCASWWPSLNVPPIVLSPKTLCWHHFPNVWLREAARARNGINRNGTALCVISCYLDDTETCFIPLWVLDSSFYVSYKRLVTKLLTQTRFVSGLAVVFEITHGWLSNCIENIFSLSCSVFTYVWNWGGLKLTARNHERPPSLYNYETMITLLYVFNR